MSTEYLDINKYSTPDAPSQEKKMNTVIMSTPIRNVADITKSAQEWHTSLDDEAKMQVHCMLSPESHQNNDANASCSVHKNGDFLNIKCFGCNHKQSLFFGEVQSNDASNTKIEYIVPIFDKEKAKQDLRAGLNDMAEIVSELVRLLPALEKKEKKDD